VRRKETEKNNYHGHVYIDYQTALYPRQGEVKVPFLVRPNAGCFTGARERLGRRREKEDSSG
jgi:hypothetical protein